jgi:hypothetical protein
MRLMLAHLIAHVRAAGDNNNHNNNHNNNNKPMQIEMKYLVVIQDPLW